MRTNITHTTNSEFLFSHDNHLSWSSLGLLGHQEVKHPKHQQSCSSERNHIVAWFFERHQHQNKLCWLAYMERSCSARLYTGHCRGKREKLHLRKKKNCKFFSLSFFWFCFVFRKKNLKESTQSKFKGWFSGVYFTQGLLASLQCSHTKIEE